MGRVESALQFVSYKIDFLNLDTEKLQNYPQEPTKDKGTWQLQFGLRQPKFYTSKNIYVGGLECSLYLFSSRTTEDQRSQSDALVSVSLGISGIFRPKEDGRFAKGVEENLVRVQIPAILFPYARATITMLLASAGLGSVIIPLINLQEVAKTALHEGEIEVLD